jgi:hypothetical protein
LWFWVVGRTSTRRRCHLGKYGGYCRRDVIFLTFGGDPAVSLAWGQSISNHVSRDQRIDTI